MIFASVDQLLHMNGHGFYVWGSYVVTLAALGVLVVLPLLVHRRLLRNIARRAQQDALIKSTIQTTAQTMTPTTSRPREN